MKPLYQVGKNMYLIGIAELAIYSFFRGDIGMTRPSFREELQSINPALAYISGAVLLICLVAIYLNKYRNVALFTIANIIFWLVTTRHIANLWRDHINGFKTLWLISGAFLILSTTA